MRPSILTQRFAALPRAGCVSQFSRQLSICVPRHEASSYIPRVASPSLWKSAIPKFMRRRKNAEGEDGTTLSTTERGPGVSLIILGLMVGSFAINILALRREMTNYSRKTHAKVELLKEVIRDLRDGKDVDVRARLGTGDPEAEAEWEEMVKEISSHEFPAPKKSAAQRKEERRKKDEAAAVEGSAASTKAQDASDAEEVQRNRPQFLM